MVVFDACAIIAYLQDEVGASVIETALLEGDCFIHAINICEVYCDWLKRGHNRESFDEVLEDLRDSGVAIIEDMHEDLWKQAAEIKARYRRCSFADCLALATTIKLNAILYSSDHRKALDCFCRIT